MCSSSLQLAQEYCGAASAFISAKEAGVKFDLTDRSEGACCNIRKCSIKIHIESSQAKAVSLRCVQSKSLDLSSLSIYSASPIAGLV